MIILDLLHTKLRLLLATKIQLLSDLLRVIPKY
jgi:hypothetical protein